MSIKFVKKWTNNLSIIILKLINILILLPMHSTAHLRTYFIFNDLFEHFQNSNVYRLLNCVITEIEI